MPPSRLALFLADPRRYAHQVDRLNSKYLRTGRLQELTQEGVSLARFVEEKATLCRALAQEGAEGAYRMEPASTHEGRL